MVSMWLRSMCAKETRWALERARARDWSQVNVEVVVEVVVEVDFMEVWDWRFNFNFNFDVSVGVGVGVGVGEGEDLGEGVYDGVGGRRDGDALAARTAFLQMRRGEGIATSSGNADAVEELDVGEAGKMRVESSMSW